jgi:serine protease Do/serine protease DegQ
MRQMTVIALVVFSVLSVPAIGSAFGIEPAPDPKKLTLQVDASPVGTGSGGLVTSYADVVEPVQRAVVSVYSTKIVAQRVQTDPLAQFFGAAPDQIREHKEEGLGSGVIVSKDGYIITNNHVVEGADELSVLLPDDREFKATVVGTDPKTDIAVIKIKANDLPTVVLADSDKLRVGDIVFAVGNPLGVGQTVTMGIVSAKGRTHLGLLEKVAGYEDFIQTDAAINMGNSGGALIDAKGRLVGINSAIVSTSRGSIGIGFAIPVNLAASIMRSLIATGTVSRGSLGVSGETLTPEVAESLGLPKDTKGVTISDVTPDGPADKAGLKRTDVVMAVNDRPVTSQEDMRLVIAQSAPGSKITLHLMRNGRPMAVEATLGRLEEHPNALMTGVDASPLTQDQLQHLNLDPRVTGLIVTRVAEDSPYADRLVAGVVVVEINRAAVTDVATARAQLHQGHNLLLIYYRGRFRYLTLTIR